jgi:hypothetical protein
VKSRLRLLYAQAVGWLCIISKESGGSASKHFQMGKYSAKHADTRRAATLTAGVIVRR